MSQTWWCTFKLCKQRLKNSTRKFEYHKNLLAEYDNVFKEQKADNIIEKVPSCHNLVKTHYLPSKPVIRHDKATTKLRMVFDTSAKVDGLPHLMTSYALVHHKCQCYLVFFYVSEYTIFQ